MKKSRPLSVMALLAFSVAVCQAQSEERVDTLATSVVTAYHSGGPSPAVRISARKSSIQRS